MNEKYILNIFLTIKKRGFKLFKTKKFQLPAIFLLPVTEIKVSGDIYLK